MYICSNCFIDTEIKSHIDSMSVEVGDCSFCGSINIPIITIEGLLEFFNELFSLYQVNESGEELVNLIQNEWTLFIPELASDILSEVLPKANFPDWKPITKVSYIDEIKENLSYWDVLKESIKWDRRFFINNDDLKDLQWDAFLADHISLDKDERFYRARIHHADGELTFPKEQMGCPYRSKVNSGRANPQGIPYLYLSRSELTTLYETKALYQDEVSIGEYRIKDRETLTLVDFTEKGSAFLGFGDLSSYTKRILLKRRISKDLSKLIRRYDSDIEYIPTQYICEFIRLIIGVDGILFTSSLHVDGQNLVVFDQEKMECLNVQKYLVTDLSISYRSL